MHHFAHLYVAKVKDALKQPFLTLFEKSGLGAGTAPSAPSLASPDGPGTGRYGRACVAVALPPWQVVSLVPAPMSGKGIHRMTWFEGPYVYVTGSEA